MAYATVADLAEWTGKSEAQIPDAARLLERASETVDYLTQKLAVASDPDTAEVLRRATCAQAEFFCVRGEEMDMQGVVRKQQVGRVSTEFGGEGDVRISPRALRILRTAGLIYGGARGR